MATRRITVLSVCPAWPESQNRPMFRGPSWGNSTASRFAPHDPKTARNRVARQEETASAATTAGLASVPERTSALPAGRDLTFGHLPHHLVVADPQARPGPPSRSLNHHAHVVRVAK